MEKSDNQWELLQYSNKLQAIFRIGTFRDEDGEPLVGVIDPLLHKFLQGHLEHYHPTMYQGNIALYKWAKKAINDSLETLFCVLARIAQQNFYL